MTPVPALDLTTSLRGDFIFPHCGHFGLEGGRPGGSNPPPPQVYGHSNTSPPGSMGGSLWVGTLSVVHTVCMLE